jgi:hypothetical protein
LTYRNSDALSMSLSYPIDPQLGKDGVGGRTGEQTTRDSEGLHDEGCTVLHFIAQPFGE